MTPKVLALLAGLCAVLALGYVFLTGEDSPPAAGLHAGALAPGQELALTPEPPEGGALPAGPAAPETPEVRRQAVPEAPDPEEERAARRAEREAAAAAGPAFTGTVFGSDGLPVPEVEVSVEGDLGGATVIFGDALKIAEETTTDRQGRFRVPRGRWPLSELSVELRARGFLVVRELRAPDTDSGDGELGDFVLPRGVVLAGQVVDAEGEPLEGASVRRTDVDDDGALDGMLRMASTFGRASDSQTETDAEGRFELLHEATGSYLIVVDHDDHPQLRQRGEAPPEGGEDLGIVLRMPPTAVIAGRILGFPEGRTGVRVVAAVVDESQDESATFAGMLGVDSDAGVEVEPDGSFEIRGLLVGRRYAVKATVLEGFFQRTTCSETEEVSSGTQALELAWESGSSVVFDVADVHTGEALRPVIVRHRWEGENQRNLMGAMAKRLEFDGSRVRIDELRPAPAPGKLELSVYVEGYLEEHVAGIQVPELEEVDLGTVHLRPAPIVRVQVVDSQSGDPIRKARVVLRPQAPGEDDELGLYAEHSAERTDSDGWCELPACATELATLEVKKGGFAPFERSDVAMPKEGTGEELVRLFEGGRVEILVVDALQEPAPDIRVIHRKPDESTSRHETNSRGEVKLSGLEAGEHAFRAERSGGRGRRRGGARVSVNFDEDEEEDWHSVVLTNGGEAELRLELPPTATIEGVVLLRGQPVTGARVSFAEGPESSASDELSSRMRERMARMMPEDATSTRTDGRGRFELQEAPLGRHRVRVARDDGSPAHYEAVDLRAGVNRVEVDLPSAAVAGRVVDGEGRPIAGATVETLRVTDEEDAEAVAQVEMAMSFFGRGNTDGVRTDYDGSFQIEGVPTDVPLVVRAQAAGYSRGQSAAIEVDPREIHRGVVIALDASGSIRVEVGGAATRFQPVTARWEGDEEDAPSPKMALLQGGSAVLRGLRPGKWRVYMTRDEEDYQLVEVRAGEQSQTSLGPE